MLGVYASTNYRLRQVLWEEFSIRLLDLDLSSLIVGNFNCINRPQEKRGERPFSGSIGAGEFRKFISQNDLLDLGFLGP